MKRQTPVYLGTNFGEKRCCYACLHSSATRGDVHQQRKKKHERDVIGCKL